MKVVLITPKPLLWTVGSMTNLHMILPSMCEDEEYFNFYRNATGYKILDNGAAEDKQVDNYELINLADALRVHEVVVPDSMADAYTTMSKVADFSRHASWSSRYRFGAVAQGTTMDEIRECVEYYLPLQWIDVLYIPRVLAEQRLLGSPLWSRGTVLEQLDREFGIYDRFEHVHLLGGTSDLREILHLRHTSVRGIDTCAPIVLAKEGTTLDEHNYIYNGRPDDYFDWKPSDDAANWKLLNNCHTYLEWAGTQEESTIIHHPEVVQDPSTDRPKYLDADGYTDSP